MTNRRLQDLLNLILFTDEITNETDNAHIEIVEAFNDLNKRIAELEQPRSCDGCLYNRFGSDDSGFAVDCTYAGGCSRGAYDRYDRYEPKDPT